MGQLLDDVIGSSKERKLDSKEERLFETSQKAWSLSENYMDTLKPLIIRRYKMYNSQHDVEEKYNEVDYKRSKYYIPKSHEFVKNSVAQVVQAYFMNPELAYLTAETSDDVVCAMSAEYFTYVLNKRLNHKKGAWLTFLETTAQSGFIHNLCIAKVDWDIEEKRTIFTPIAIENFRVDPYADPLDPIGSSPFLIHRTEMYISDIKVKQEENGWLDISVEDLQSNFVNNNDNEDVNNAREKEGVSNKHNHGSLGGALQKVFVHENIIREGKTYYVFYTLGTSKMLTKLLPLKDIYPQGLPFVFAPLYPEEGKVYPAAPLDHAYTAQVLLNDLSNLAMDAIHQDTWPVTVVRAGSGIDVRKYKQVGPNSVLEARNPSTDIHQIRRAVSPQSLKNELPFVMSNFDSTTGGLPNSTLSVDNSDSTATGQHMKNRLGSQVIGMYLMNFNEKFVEPVLELILKCERIHGIADTKYVDKVFKSLGLLKRYGQKLIDAQLNPNDFNVNEEFADAELNLSVNVGMGAVSPQLRIEQLLGSVSQVKNLFPELSTNIDGEEVSKEIFSLNGYKDVNRFINNEVDPEKEQLKAQIQQLQSELAQKKSPDELAADIRIKNATEQEKLKKMQLLDSQIKKVEAETIGVNVNNQLLALDGGEKLAIMPEVAVGGDKLMENAGAVDPTPEDPMF